MNESNSKPSKSILRILGLRAKPKSDAETETASPQLTPAMPELGTAPCPVCGHSVAVFVTRTKRPFINCGFCSARIFYNGSRSQRLLQKQIAPIEEGQDKGSLGALSGLKTITGGKND